MSYGEYKFGDFAKHYNVGGPSDGLVGFAEGFAKGFVPTYMAANKAARDKDLALAKLDRQAENDAANAKITANKKYKENRESAQALVNGVAIPEGISEADLIIWTAGQLDAGRTPTSVAKDLRDGVSGGLFEYEGGGTPDTTPSATPEAAPAPVDTGPTTPLDRQMNEALGEQTSSDTTSEEPESALQPLLSSVDAEADDGSYQEASLGNDWEDRFRERTQKRNADNAGTLVASLDTQTDVTNPAGLGGGDEPTSQIVLKGGEGTPSDRLAATTGALRLRPAAKAATAEELDVSKVDDYDKALAAQVALTGVDGQEEKKAQVNFLLDQFTKMPKLGDMNSQQLQEFIASAETDPQYANIDSQVLSGTISRAEGYLEDLNKNELPSLTETDLTKLQGVQADIASGRYSFDISQEYTNQLAGRVSALEAKAEAERIAGITFNEAYVEKLALLKYEEIQSNPDLNAGQKIAAMQQWMDNEGKQLQQLLRFGDKPEKPREINSIDELGVTNLMASDAWKNADNPTRETMIADLKAQLSGSKKDTLTSGQLAQNLAQARLNLTSSDPKVVADAQLYIEAVYPTQRQALADVSSIGKTPNRDTVAVLTDGRRVAVMSDGNNGYTDLQGNAVTDIDYITTEKMSDNTRAAVTAISGPLDEQAAKMAAAVNVATLGYELEKMATKYEAVLTRAGGAQAFLSSVRTEIGAALSIIGEASDNQDLNQETILQKVNEHLSNSALSEEEAATVKEFMAASTRYIFAAGKALGQEGNGFSNQDYNNIRSALLNSNNLKSFGGNMRTFARERLTDATRTARQLAGRTGVRQAQDYGGTIGNEIFTADQYFTMLGEGVPDAVDYMAWAYKGAPIDVPRVGGGSTSQDTPKTGRLVEGEDGIYRLAPAGDDD